MSKEVIYLYVKEHKVVNDRDLQPVELVNILINVNNKIITHQCFDIENKTLIFNKKITIAKYRDLKRFNINCIISREQVEQIFKKANLLKHLPQKYEVFQQQLEYSNQQTNQQILF